MIRTSDMNVRAAADAKRLILGCGTGRCGTVSLVKLLNVQTGISMFHEGVTGNSKTHHLAPWYDGETQLWAWLTELENLSGVVRWYGDAAAYFLPYLPAIFKRYPASCAICLERPRKAVIRSFMKKTEGRNHWYRHEGAGWTVDPEWDGSFPCYAEPDKSRAIGLYWDQYHCTALEYCARFPDQFMLLPTAALNTLDGRRKILEFVGYDQGGVTGGEFHANASYKNRVRRSLARLSSVFRSDDRS